MLSNVLGDKESAWGQVDYELEIINWNIRENQENSKKKSSKKIESLQINQKRKSRTKKATTEKLPGQKAKNFWRE